MEKIEYRVRPVTRYVVTRYHEAADGRTGGSEVKGEYDNHDMAYEVAYALAKHEHDQLGYPPGDERIKYPEPKFGHGLTVTECADMAAVREAIGGDLYTPSAQRAASR